MVLFAVCPRHVSKTKLSVQCQPFMITSSDRQFKGGLVVPYFISVSEEDEGQDEKTENDPQYVGLGAITLIKHNNQSKLFNFVVVTTLILFDYLKSQPVLHQNGMRLEQDILTISKDTKEQPELGMPHFFGTSTVAWTRLGVLRSW